MCRLDAPGRASATLPSQTNPVVGRVADDRPLPRLDPADIELGLRYVPECRVLVLAEPLTDAPLAAALDAADYHGAAIVMVAAEGSVDAAALGDSVTLLEPPASEDVEGADEATVAANDAARNVEFAGFIAEYAVRLDAGESPAEAFGAVIGDSAWEPSVDDDEAQ